MRFHHTVLDNGLEVVAELNDRAYSVAAGFFVKTGSRDEVPEVAGVSLSAHRGARAQRDRTASRATRYWCRWRGMSTSSTRSTSGSARTATENPSRTIIPDE